MKNREIGVILTADATGLQRGLTQATSSAQSFAAQAEGAFGRAAASSSRLSHASAEAAKAASGYSAATRATAAAQERFIRDLERSVVAIGRTKSEMLELQAAELGVSSRAAPMIAHLRQAESSLGRVGMSAAATANAMRMVPMQMTDIVTQLAGGQNPFLIMVQQGGQLRDTFDGVIPAIRGVATYIARLVNPFTVAAAGAAALFAAYYQGSRALDALQNHLTMTGNALGATTGQVSDMAARMDNLANVTRGGAVKVLTEVATSGKIAGDQIETVGVIAMRSAQLLGRETADVVSEFAKLAEKPAEASAELNEKYNYLTASVYRQIRALEDQGRADEAAALAQETYASATIERLNQVEGQLGLLEQAWRGVKSAAKEMWDEMAGIGRPKTTLEKLNEEVEKFNSLKVLGNISLVGDPFDAIKKQQYQVAALRSQLESEEISAGLAENIANAEKSRIAAEDAWRKQGEALRSRMERRDEEIANARKWAAAVGASEAELANRLEQINEKYKDRSSGKSAGQSELARLNAMLVLERQRAEQLAVFGGEVEKLNEAEKLALQYAERAKLATDAKTKARLEHNKSLAEEVGAMRRANDLTEKDLRAADQTINKLRQQTQSIEDQVATYGLGKVAIEDLAIARLEEKLAIDESLGGHDAVIAKTREELEARKQLREAMVSLETKEAEKRAWESWSRDVEQIFQQVGQSLTDAIFEGGKSGRELVKDLFKTLTLRVLINPVMNSIQGAVTNSLGGMFGLQNPQQGGVMGAANNLSSMNSIFGAGYQALTGASAGASTASLGYANLVGAFGGDSIGALISANGGWQGAMAGFGAAGAAGAGLAGVTAGSGLAASLGGTLGGTMATTGFSASLAGAGAAGAGAAGAGAAAGGLAGIGSAIGAALPWVGGALAIGSLLGGDLFGGGPPKTRHGQRTTAELAGGRYGITSTDDRMPAGTDAAVLTMAQAGVDMANELFRRVGVDAAIDSFYAIAESSVLGDRNGVASGGVLRTGDQTRAFGIPQASDMTLAGVGGWSEAETLPRLQTDIQLSILEAFQTQVDSLPDVLADMIRGVDVRALDAAGAQDLAARFSAVVEGASSFLQLVQTMPFDQLRDLSFDAAAGLVEVAGGLQNLTGNLNTYYENFHTEAERNANTLRNVAAALEEVGVALPDTRQQFRALVEAQDLTTDAGRRVYAALLNVSGAFASVTQSAEQAAQEQQRFAQEQQRVAQQQRDEALSNLQSAYSAMVSAGQAEIARLQQSFGATDSAMNAYRSAVQALESEFGSLFSSIDRYISDLRGNVEASAAAQYRQARDVISTALATGQLPQTADLTEALQIAQRGVTSQVYSSLFEQNRAYAIFANEMEALKAIAEPELDAAKATLAQLEEQYALLRGTNRIAGDSLSALEQQVRLAFATEEAARHEISLVEQQLELARQQHEKLMEMLTGIDGGIKSLAEAMAAYAAAAAAAKQAVPGGGGGTGGWTPGNLPAGAENLSAAERYVLYNEDLLKDYSSSGMTAQEYADFHWNTYGQYEDRDIRYRAAGGYTPPGLTWVGEEGPELVNFKQPGMVYTAAQSANLMGGGGGEVVSELRALREQNARLERRLASIEQSTGQLADQFDNVTAGGNAMATEEMA